jgi:hypothetical protein
MIYIVLMMLLELAVSTRMNCCDAQLTCFFDTSGATEPLPLLDIALGNVSFLHEPWFADLTLINGSVSALASTSFSSAVPTRLQSFGGVEWTLNVSFSAMVSQGSTAVAVDDVSYLIDAASGTTVSDKVCAGGRRGALSKDGSILYCFYFNPWNRTSTEEATGGLKAVDLLRNKTVWIANRSFPVDVDRWSVSELTLDDTTGIVWFSQGAFLNPQCLYGFNITSGIEVARLGCVSSNDVSLIQPALSHNGQIVYT